MGDCRSPRMPGPSRSMARRLLGKVVARLPLGIGSMEHLARWLTRKNGFYVASLAALRRLGELQVLRNPSVSKLGLGGIMSPVTLGSQASNYTGLRQTDCELREAHGEEHRPGRIRYH